MNYIYIGPNIFPLGLQQHQLFLVDEPNKFLKELAAENHWILSMYIPTSELALARKRIEQPGTIEHRAFQYLKELSVEKIQELIKSEMI